MNLDKNPLFKNYFKNISYDEMFTPSKEVKSSWLSLYEKLNALGSDVLTNRQKELDWLLLENGVTYNIYDDPKGLNRPWNLNSIPFIIHNNEWKHIEKGIKQRVKLYNLILKDIYGARKLIKNGLIPQEVIYAHKGFLRQCDKINYTFDKLLLVFAAEISRGPDGRMWVVNNRVEAPSGIGYALENRTNLSKVHSEIFNEMNVKRLTDFLYKFNDLLINVAPNKNENPNIVILTPGSHNETYFEHAFLASYFGYPLVLGNDLIVRDGFLWMKSLKGLKKIDVVYRRVDDAYVDPLELQEDSHLGVAGLLDVVRKKNVTIINPIGAAVVENPGLIPFLPAISKYLLDEELILPQIASWWCGQEKEKDYVLKNIKKLVIKKIDKSNRESIHFGMYLSDDEIKEVKNEINKRPYKYVAQEHISFSTTPTFSNGKFEPRKMVCRTFAIACSEEGYTVMPGGLVRVASKPGNVRVSNQRGGINKDLWITNDDKPVLENLYPFKQQKSNVITSGLDDLPSLTAENLFWAGRNLGRTLSVARHMRVVLNQFNSHQSENKRPDSQKIITLLKSLTHLTNTFPGFVEDDEDGNSALDNPITELHALVLDANRYGSLTNTIQLFSNSYFSIRNLWSADMWRVFYDIKSIWEKLTDQDVITNNLIVKSLDKLITRLIAFMGLIEESIKVDQGLLLYFIGLRMEQNLLTIAKVRAIVVPKYNDYTEHELLIQLLNSHESLNIYIQTYRSNINRENVLELLLMDVKYPRSLAFMLKRLWKDVSRLPHSNIEELHNYEKCVINAIELLNAQKITDLVKIKPNSYVREDLDTMLENISELLFETSQSITNRYFNHTLKQEQLASQNFTTN